MALNPSLLVLTLILANSPKYSLTLPRGPIQSLPVHPGNRQTGEDHRAPRPSWLRSSEQSPIWPAGGRPFLFLFSAGTVSFWVGLPSLWSLFSSHCMFHGIRFTYSFTQKYTSSSLLSAVAKTSFWPSGNLNHNERLIINNHMDYRSSYHLCVVRHQNRIILTVGLEMLSV